MRKLLAVLFNIHHPGDLEARDKDFIYYHQLLDEQYQHHNALREALHEYEEVCRVWGVGTPDQLDTLLRKLHDHINELQKDRVCP